MITGFSIFGGILAFSMILVQVRLFGSEISYQWLHSCCFHFGFVFCFRLRAWYVDCLSPYTNYSGVTYQANVLPRNICVWYSQEYRAGNGLVGCLEGVCGIEYQMSELCALTRSMTRERACRSRCCVYTLLCDYVSSYLLYRSLFPFSSSGKKSVLYSFACTRSTHSTCSLNCPSSSSGDTHQYYRNRRDRDRALYVHLRST